VTAAPHAGHEEHATRAEAAARVARLYEKHGRMVYGVCRALLRDGHEAEDAAQQTFLLVHRALLGGARVRNDAGWLATIARNECRTRIAASMRSPLPISDEDLAAIPTSGDEVEQSAQREAIRAALADLPERQREAVVLRDLYGLRCWEVAAALGLSRPATEALLFRARRALRHRLKPMAASVLVVPVAIEEGLAQAIPGFAVAGSGGVGAAAVGGGLLAKLTAGPVGVKVATATLAVTTVGAVGSVESERAGRDRAQRDAIVEVDDTRSPSGSVSSSSPARAGSDDDAEDLSDEDGGGSSGPGGGDDSGDDNSGPGSGDAARDDDDRSGSGGGGDDSGGDNSGSGSSSSGRLLDGDGSGSGSSGGSSSSGSGSSGSSGSSTDDDSSGSGSSGSGSSSGSSSGSGSSSSGPSSGGETTVEDSSGSGSGSSGSGGPSSGSGSDGSDSSSGDSGSSGSGSGGSGSGGGDSSGGSSSGNDADEVEDPD
jgi:RNA polymerase sigma factor (sigma-70 family)